MSPSRSNDLATHEPLQGLFPPLLLPLGATGEIDFESLGRQVDFLLTGGVDGLWVNGTTGDFFALTDDENETVFAAVKRQVRGRVPVVAQAGDTATRRVIAKAKRVLAAGADYIAVVLPYYLDYSQTELESHYRAVSQALGRPVILYQLPQMCKVALTIPGILKLVREGVLVGIKDSSGDMEFYRKLTAEVARENLPLRCFVGSGALMQPSLQAGGHGLMCAIANLVPQLCKQVYDAAVVKDWDRAIALQAKVQELIDAMKLPDRTNWAATVAVYKWLLRSLGIVAHDQVIAPLQPLSDAEKLLLQERALPLLKKHSAGLLKLSCEAK